VAANVFNELAYGKDSIRARNILGSIESVDSITVEDLRAFYSDNFSPSIARMHVVGSLDKASVIKPLADLNKKWPAKKVSIAKPSVPKAPTESKVYFYDIPGAKQSVIGIGYPALAENDKDFYPATVANYILGGGGFASQLTQQLREGKGYTYGIRSGFNGSNLPGTFQITSGVRTNVTLESLRLVKQILDDYGKNYSERDLETTKGFLIKSNARAFETAGAKLNMLDNISSYGWKPDYVTSREEIVRGMTVEKIRELSAKYLNSGKMIWLVVGDAETQLPRMKELGFGEPVLLNKK
jgi:zinc protease